MALFYPDDPNESGPFVRYRTILERDWQSFYMGGLVTLAGFLPFGVGMFFAISSASVLVMLASAVVGGLFAGPAFYAFYDLLFRSLRNATTHWWKQYRLSIRKNWASALLPGIVLCLFLGFFIFMAMLLFFWAERFTGWGNVIVLLASVLIITMFFSVYWPQLVLFKQKGLQRLRNCILFCVKYFWHVLGAAALQTVYWLLIALFLPWSTLVLAVIGLWFILFVTNFLLYRDLDEAFEIEKAIRENFPEQMQGSED